MRMVGAKHQLLRAFETQLVPERETYDLAQGYPQGYPGGYAPQDCHRNY